MAEAFVTCTGQLRYARSLWTARRFQNNPANPLRYSCSLIIEKANPGAADVINRFNQEAMTIEGTQPPAVAGGLCILPYGKKACLMDGALRYANDPFYADKWILSCGLSDDDGAPKVLLSATQPVIDKADIYDGVVVQILLNFYAYKGGQGGVNAGLRAVMKVADGERIGQDNVDAGAAFTAAGAVGSGSTVAPATPAPAGFNVPGQPQQPQPQQQYAQQPVQPAYNPHNHPQPTVAPGQPVVDPNAPPW